MGKLVHISEISRQTVGCKNCSKQVIFGENQWRQRCPRCGITITIPKCTVITSAKPEQPECFICNDKGIVHYQAQEMNGLYQFTARCVCKAGDERKEAYPLVAEVVDHMPDIKWLIQKNRDEWVERYGERTLFDGAEQVDAADVPFN